MSAGPDATRRTASEGFEAYERDAREIGVRNNVLVLPSVICSHLVADRIADAVPNAVSAPHDHGCAQIGVDNDQTRRTFMGLAANPNIAGTVVVGLGCEVLQSEEVAAGMADLDVPVRELSIQGAGGTDECIQEGIEHAEDLVETAETAGRTTGSLGDLTLGVVSSDLSASTLDEADPLIGSIARRVVGAGGRVVVAGIERFTAHSDRALAAATEPATQDLQEILSEWQDRPAKMTRVRADADNHEFDDLARLWDGLPITEAIQYGEVPEGDSGVTVLNAPSQYEEAATGLAAAGAQVILHATADGIPTGHPMVPVIKVSGDPATVAALPDDIDLDASRTTSEEAVATVESVTDGAACAAEGHGLTEFAITRVGPSM
jgi:altronate dehydratase large subunit